MLHCPRPAGECSEECGTGEAARPLTCVSKTYSLPVTLDNCNYNITDVQALEGGCGREPPCLHAGRFGAWLQAERAGGVHELRGC